MSSSSLAVVLLALVVCALTGARAQHACGDVSDAATLVNCSSANSVVLSLWNDKDTVAIVAPFLTAVAGRLQFQNSQVLSSASFPVLASVDGWVDFYYNQVLQTASFPALKSIGGMLYLAYNGLTTVSFPALSSVGGYVYFNSNRALTTISLPVLSTVGDWVDIGAGAASQTTDVWWLANANSATASVTLRGKNNVHCTGNNYWLPGADVKAAHCCSRNPCQNGGSCQYTATNYFSCLCAPGFSGALCQNH